MKGVGLRSIRASGSPSSLKLGRDSFKHLYSSCQKRSQFLLEFVLTGCAPVGNVLPRRTTPNATARTTARTTTSWSGPDCFHDVGLYWRLSGTVWTRRSCTSMDVLERLSSTSDTVWERLKILSSAAPAWQHNRTEGTSGEGAAVESPLVLGQVPKGGHKATTC